MRLTNTLEHADDLEALRQQCGLLDAKNTVLDLKLSGQLKEQDLLELNALVDDLNKRFLHVDREQDIAHVLEAAEIARRYPEGTLPHALLTDLLADEDHPGDANLALQLIQELKK